MAYRSPKPNRPSQLQRDDWGRVTYYRAAQESRGRTGYAVAALLLVAVAVLCLAGFLLVRVLLPNSPPVVLPSFITRAPSTSSPEPEALPSASPSPNVSPGEAQVTMNPSQGFVNTLITVGGQGWWPNEPVFVFLRSPEEGEGRGFAYAAAVADEWGSFRTALTFPNEIRWVGQPWAEVIARGNRSEIEASARFVLVPPTPTDTVPPPTPRPTQPPTVTPSVTDTPWPTATPWPSPTPVVVITDWRGEYYTNMAVSGEPALVRNDVAVDFNWGAGSPAPGIPVDGFSARWTRPFHFEEGPYRFFVRADDGVRFWIDGQIHVDEWHDSSGETHTFEVYLSGGTHSLQLDYYENVGGAMIQVGGQKIQTPTPSPTPLPTSTPTATATPAVPTATPVIPTDTPPPPVLEAWWAEYYDNPALQGRPVLARRDAQVDFDWGDGSPDGAVPVDGFSAQWSRELWMSAGVYRFYLQVDDGVRLWLDGMLLLDEWHGYTGDTYMAEIEVPGGIHRIRIEYYEDVVLAHIHFWLEQVY